MDEYVTYDELMSAMEKYNADDPKLWKQTMMDKLKQMEGREMSVKELWKCYGFGKKRVMFVIQFVEQKLGKKIK